MESFSWNFTQFWKDSESQLGIPIGIAISPDGKYAHAGNCVIRTSDNSLVAKDEIGVGPGAAITSDGKYLYNSYFAEEFKSKTLTTSSQTRVAILSTFLFTYSRHFVLSITLLTTPLRSATPK